MNQTHKPAIALSISIRIPVNLPHKPGYIPDFCKNKGGIAKSKFLDKKRI
jgi:hypothetical protein